MPDTARSNVNEAPASRSLVERPRESGRARGGKNSKACLKVKRLSNEHEASFPPGLVKYLGNYHETHRRGMELFYGLRDESDVLKDFRKMKQRVSGRFMALQDQETGEVKPVPVRSRWNSSFNYRKHVWRWLMKDMRGLRATTLLTLTVAPKRVEALMPPWWTCGLNAFLVMIGNVWVSAFLKRLERHKARRGEKWNYLCSVAEFQKSGRIHYHLLFYGGFIASIDDICRMWGLSERNGVDVKRVNGLSAVAYVTKYLTKAGVEPERNSEEEKLQAWMWFFCKRMFNVRHTRKGKTGERTFDLPKQKQRFVCIGWWRGENDVILFKDKLGKELEELRQWMALRDAGDEDG